VTVIQRNRPSLAGFSNITFTAMIVHRLRAGTQPSHRALEQAAFVEQWAIVPDGEIFELTGVAWRLPLCKAAFAAPLLAINPTAGWARTVEEWLVIEHPRSAGAAELVYPDEVARRAEIWVRHQVAAEAATGAVWAPYADLGFEGARFRHA
jgi:hypothetical protein